MLYKDVQKNRLEKKKICVSAEKRAIFTYSIYPSGLLDSSLSKSLNYFTTLCKR